MTAYEAAEAVRRRLSDQYEAILARVRADHPAPARLCYPAGLGVRAGEQRFFTVEQIDGEKTLSFDKKVELVELLRAYDAEVGDAEKASGIDDLDAELSVAEDAAFGAQRALYETPAPDIAALAYKQRMAVAGDILGGPMDEFDDGRAISEALTVGDYDDACVAMLTQDVFRLAGIGGPVVEARKFDAGAFIAEFESFPNHSCRDGRPAFYSVDGKGEAPGMAMLRDLAGWQRKEVYKLASNRARANRIAEDVREHYAGSWITRAETEEALRRRHSDVELPVLRMAWEIIDAAPWGTFGADAPDNEVVIAAQPQ